MAAPREGTAKMEDWARESYHPPVNDHPAPIGALAGSAAEPAKHGFVAATIIARNYLPYARELARSLQEQHTGIRLRVLVVDWPPVPESDGTMEMLGPLDLALSRDEFLRMVAAYDVMELATALKPWLLRRLLKLTPGPALYLDPDIEVLAPLDDLAALADRHGIVLTPHAVEPVPRDRRRPAEAELMASGVFNLGMIAVSRDADPFLSWWEERLSRDAIVDPEHMLFTDQRWVDLAVGHFHAHVERDPGYNVAYWNASTRSLSNVGGRFYAGDSLLRTFHFSGFQPERPHLLTRHSGERPRVLLSENAAVRDLCEGYSARLMASGYTAPLTPEYGYHRLPGGVKMDRRMRRAYRAALIDFDQGLGPEPPNPFRRGDGDAFLGWLAEPVAAHSPLVGRYLFHLYQERTDLQAVFPHVPGADSSAYLDWVHRYGRTEAGVPDALLPAPPVVPGARVGHNAPAPTRGVNLVRMEATVGGISTVAAGLGLAAAASGASVVDVGYRPGQLLTLGLARVVGRRLPPHDINLVSVNASHMADLALRAGQAFFDRRYTIGQWAWETERLPPELARAGDLVDEVWVASEFERAAIQPAISKPVFLFPMPVPQPSSPSLLRSDLDLPDGFLFLFCFDYLSELERKNPLGLIEAFSRAFEPGSGPRLVIKSLHGEQRLLDRERLRLAAMARPDVVLLEGEWPDPKLEALMAACDCYVSLHRSEGFGLTLAEAMVRGRPVIATGYSGNLQFMSETNGFLVRNQLGGIGTGVGPYPSDQIWAEPDLDHAAWLMRHVVSDRGDATRRAEAGRSFIAERHSLAATSAFISQRLLAIRQQEHRRHGFAAHPGPDATPEGASRRHALGRAALRWVVMAGSHHNRS